MCRFLFIAFAFIWAHLLCGPAYGALTGPADNVSVAAARGHAGYEGHIRDKATGLSYMHPKGISSRASPLRAQARYYDPVIGRFLSIDPVTFMDTGNPSYFNRYRYCANDPVNCIDPNGKTDVRTLHQASIRNQSATAGSAEAHAKSGLAVVGLAIIIGDIATIPSGEGSVGVGRVTAAFGRQVAVDAGVGVGTDAAINVIDQVVQADGDLTQTDFAAAASATLENAPESTLGGIIGGSGGRRLDGALSPLKGNAANLTGDAMTDAFIGAVENHGSTFLGSVGGSVAANELVDEGK